MNNLPLNPSRLDTCEAVLFDLDGTVVNTIPHILASFRYATTEIFGAPRPDEELLRHVGVPLAVQALYLAGDEKTAERLVASYKEFNHRMHDEMAKLYPNTLSTLEVLHAAGLPMAIVTSKGRMMAEKAIDLFDLGTYFPVVVTSEDTVAHKPDPAPVLYGAGVLGFEPSRVAYVGDSPVDMESGRGAGAATIAATWGVASRERLAATSPDAIIDDISELPALIGIGA